MHSGRQSFISKTSVQAVLDTLMFSTTHKFELDSLQHLFLVEKILFDPKTPEGEDKVLYILQSILVDIITSQLTQIRTRFHLNVDENETYEVALQSLLDDMMTKSNDLLCWSILYYLYVQVDLGFNTDLIAQTIGVASRTVRRYREQGVDILTSKLWQLEDESRREFHNKVIHKQLQPLTSNLVGRDQQIGEVLSRLCNNHSKAVYVYGGKGIGKTSFVKYCIMQLINEIDVDDVLWIRDVDVKSLVLQLKNHYLLDTHPVSLQSVFSLFNCIIVFDDIDDLLKSGDIEQLLNLVDGATIFFSSQRYFSLPTESITRISLPPLNEHQLEKLIKMVANDDIPQSMHRQIIEMSGGNPAHLYEVINYHRYALSSNSEEDIFNQLKLEQQYILASIPIEGIQLFEFKTLCEVINISERDIDLLFDVNLITRADDYIYSVFESETIVKSMVDIKSYLKQLITVLHHLQQPSVIGLHILMDYKPYIDKATKRAIVKICWRDGLTYNKKIHWHTVLLSIKFESTTSWLYLARGISYKSINQLQQAELLLLDALEISGLNGEFDIQAETVVELVKVYRLNGEYKKSTHYLELLTNGLENYLSFDQLNTLILEKSQLALDMNQVNYALSLVTSLETFQAFTLKAECLYRLTEYQECIDLCNEILSDFFVPDVVKGIIHNLIGRCYQMTDTDFELSSEQYSLAIEYFSESFNLRHLSRAQINLATSFIYMEELDKAIELFNRAEEICSIVKDVVGLKIIEKNRNYIHRLIISQYN